MGSMGDASPRRYRRRDGVKLTHNTPQPMSSSAPPASPQRTVSWLERNISNYVEDCNKGYCRLDEKELAKLKKELAIAKVTAEERKTVRQ